MLALDSPVAIAKPLRAQKEGPSRRKYEKGEKRLKHVGSTATATVDDGNPKKVIGKCPNNIPDATKEAVLQTAIPELSADRDVDFPWRLFAVHEGVIYDCRTTTRGQSYHAFPYHGEMLRSLHDRLEQSEDAKAHAREFKHWVSKHVKVIG
jgi:hypothetical protein